MAMIIDIGAASTIGAREKQEDSYMAYHMVEDRPKESKRFSATDTRSVYMGVLCDGMGGMKNGAWCSRQAVQAYGEAFAETGSFNTMWKERMFMSLYAANAAIHDFKVSEGLQALDSGCTLVSVVICDARLHYISVGDSYIVLYRKKDKKQDEYTATQLNALHVGWEKFVPEADGNMVRISVEEDEIPALRNEGVRVESYLCCAVLGKEIEALDYQMDIDLQDGDIIMLASDGVMKGLGEIERENLIRNFSEVPAKQLAEEFIRRIDIGGAPRQDNAACIMFKVSLNQ